MGTGRVGYIVTIILPKYIMSKHFSHVFKEVGLFFHERIAEKEKSTTDVAKWNRFGDFVCSVVKCAFDIFITAEINNIAYKNIFYVMIYWQSATN